MIIDCNITGLHQFCAWHRNNISQSKNWDSCPSTHRCCFCPCGIHSTKVTHTQCPTGMSISFLFDWLFSARPKILWIRSLCFRIGGYTCVPQAGRRADRKRRKAAIILLNCRNSETCNKKQKPPFHDHLEYLPGQKLLSGWGFVWGGGVHIDLPG